MGTIADKLTYLNETKIQFKEKLNKLGADILDNTTFRNYLIYLNNLYNGLFNLTDMSENGIVGRTNQEDTPTPSTPQEIKDLSGDITYSVGGKNLFDYNDITTSAYYTNNYDGSFTRTSNGSNVIINADAASVPYNSFSLMAGTYSVSFDITTTSAVTFSSLFLCTVQNGTGSNLAKNIGVQIPANTKVHIKAENYVVLNNAEKVGIVGYVSASTGIVISNIQVEKGSTATTYEEYIPKKDFTLSLNADDNDIHLNKIGIYQDKIYAKDNKFYLHKQIGKFTYNNEGSFTTPATNYYNINGLGNQGWITTIQTQTYISTEYPPISVLNTDSMFREATANMDYAFGIHPNGTGIRFKDSRGLSGADFKTDLIGTEIYFALSTSSTTEITSTSHPTLYNQLKEIQDYLIKYKSKYELILNYDKPNIKY